MEAMGEWNTYTTTEEADFMAQLLGWSYGGSATNAASAGVYPNQTSVFYGCGGRDHDGGGGGGFVVTRREESSSYSGGSSGYYAVAPNINGSMSLDAFEDPSEINTSSYFVEETTVSDDVSRGQQDDLQPSDSDRVDQKARGVCDGFKKRSRAAAGDKNKRNKKAKKAVEKSCENNNDDNSEGEEEEEKRSKNKARLKRRTSSNTCCSEGGSSWSQDTTKIALNLNGKTRASRGAATDPQSLYARKRRERINERLRILQNLVPNGTKVDLSTMLEEAVHYVKFLQLQIKLLSSDELWMYAPIAYNGMDIDLDRLAGER